jgi:hypothetical protein
VPGSKMAASNRCRGGSTTVGSKELLLHGLLLYAARAIGNLSAGDSAREFKGGCSVQSICVSEDST